MDKGMIVILQMNSVKRASMLGYVANPEAFDQSNTFLILHTDLTMETTNSKKIWSSSQYISLTDEDFLRIPIPASVDDYCIERAGVDISIFQVKTVEPSVYVSTDGLEYSKDNSSKIERSLAESVIKMLGGAS